MSFPLKHVETHVKTFDSTFIDSNCSPHLPNHVSDKKSKPQLLFFSEFQIVSRQISPQKSHPTFPVSSPGPSDEVQSCAEISRWEAAVSLVKVQWETSRHPHFGGFQEITYVYIHIYICTHTHIYIYIYKYMYVGTYADR